MAVFSPDRSLVAPLSPEQTRFIFLVARSTIRGLSRLDVALQDKDGLSGYVLAGLGP